MKIENGLKGALPDDRWSRWSDEQLGAIFANGVNISRALTGIKGPDFHSGDAILDNQYLEAQLRSFGINPGDDCDLNTFREFHGVFDIRPVVAAYLRDLKRREHTLEVEKLALPPREAVNTSDQKGIDRINTFIGALMRHSYEPLPAQTQPETYQKFLAANPPGRSMEGIRILQLPSIVTPPNRRHILG